MYKMKYLLRITVLILCIMMCGCGKANNSSTSVDTGKYCTLFVECSEAIKNKDRMEEGLLEYLPDNGIILKETRVSIEEGNSVYDVLEKTMRQEGIPVEASFTGDIAYVEGIDNLYEFDCGELSGWTYSVNGEYSPKGCSSYSVEDGDKIEWHYTCDLGHTDEGE